jgi:anthranilate phosphoribosyltransferase
MLGSAGVPIDLEPEAAGRILDSVGLVFLFAPMFHPAMKELGTVRRELGVRTIFNALGPLANPAGATRQMIGVGRPDLAALLADALAALGAERAIVFHSENGSDELVPGVPAAGMEVNGGGTRPWRFDPAGLSQRTVSLAELAGGDAAGNAAMLERLLDGEDGPRREAVLLNAALALVVEGRARNVPDGYERARSAVDKGAARAVFDNLKKAGSV